MLLLSGCSESQDVGEPPTTETASPTAPGSVPTSTSSVATTRSTRQGPTSTASTVDPGAPPVAGGSDWGDPYFEGLGNTGYDALSYDLHFVIDPKVAELAGTTTMRAVATIGLSAFNLDFSGLEVLSVEVGDEAAGFRHEDQELVITPVLPIEAGAIFEVTVVYTGEPRGVPSPAWRDLVGWTAADDFTYVVSEPVGAHGWYPVNDHPGDKATYTISANVPVGTEVVANGVLESIADGGDGTETWRYVARDPIASYLVTMAVGEFVIRESVSETGIAIRDAYSPATEARAKPAVERQSEMIAVFEDLFGPYPFEVYGALIVDDDFGGALEKQTLSVFSAGVLGGSSGEAVVAHELGHQWFGDSLTPSAWQDIWLNEGFATYSEWLWSEVSNPSFDIDEKARSVATSGGPVWSAPGSPGPEGLFDPTVYFRGALTLHALRLTVGDDAFFATLRTYVERFAYRNVSTADFIAVAEEVSGRALTDLFDVWLYDDRTPELPET